MTTSSTRPPKPRRRCEPSQRDQQIYLDYQTTGRTQVHLAEQHKLTQCRISQIIRRVENWLAKGDRRREGEAPAEPVHSPSTSSTGSRLEMHDPEAPASSDTTCNLEPETCNSAELDRALQRRYMSFVCREAIRQFQTDRVTVTTKKGSRGDTPIDETTKRREPPPLQCLNTLLRACTLLDRLTQKQPAQGRVSLAGTRTAHGSSNSAKDSRPPSRSPDASLPNSIPRDAVEAWILENRNANAKDFNGEFSGHFARDLVNMLLGQTATGISLDILARDLNKVLVPKKEGDYSFPPGGGWYRAVYDEDGQFLHHERAEVQTLSDEDVAERGADIPIGQNPSGADIPACQNPSGADIPVCQDRETEETRDGETNAKSGMSVCFSPSPSLPPPPAQTTTITISAPEATSSQPSRLNRLPSGLAPAKTAFASNTPNIVPELRPLYDKVVSLHRRRSKGLPCRTDFTPEEESQLWRLPPIFLEDA